MTADGSSSSVAIEYDAAFVRSTSDNGAGCNGWECPALCRSSAPSARHVPSSSTQAMDDYATTLRDSLELPRPDHLAFWRRAAKRLMFMASHGSERIGRYRIGSGRGGRCGRDRSSGSGEGVLAA